jgi:pimeloyl-ACP methyl ester carboxylesterase
MVVGYDGGFDGPAAAIYPTLADDLAEHGIGTLRIDFRDRLNGPGIVPNGVTDVRAGIEELRRRGVESFALVGHSFGGAVMIATAVLEPAVRTVVTLSSQSAGGERVAELAPRPILFVHGLDDRRLPPEASRFLYDRAREPKQIVLLEGARHSLRQRREELRRLVRDWLVEKLTP